MKPILPLLAVFCLALPAPDTVSQTFPQPPTVSVSGSAEVKVTPDDIDLRFGVETRSEQLPDAKRENDERVAKTLAFLKANGIRPKDVQTDFLSLEPVYHHDLSRLQPVAYVARKSIGVKLDSLDRFEGILAGVLTNGVTHVHGIDFRTTQLRKHRDTARAMATRAAREKAEAIASELGVRCGKVHSINANEYGGWWGGSGSYWGNRFGGAMMQNAVQNLAPAGESQSSTLALGQISVSATVNATFLIEP